VYVSSFVYGFIPEHPQPCWATRRANPLVASSVMSHAMPSLATSTTGYRFMIAPFTRFLRMTSPSRTSTLTPRNLRFPEMNTAAFSIMKRAYHLYALCGSWSTRLHT